MLCSRRGWGQKCPPESAATTSQKARAAPRTHADGEPRPQTAVKFCRELQGRAFQLRVKGDHLSLTVAAAGLGARSQGCLLCTSQQVFPRAVSLLRLQTASLGRKSQKSQPGLTGSRRPCLGRPCTLDAFLVASGCPAASSGPTGRP